MQSRQEGFSLIELLIVVGLVLLITAIAVPCYMNSRVQAHEAAAVASVRSIATAERTYTITYHGNYATLDQLGAGGGDCSAPSVIGACLIDNMLATGSKSGYQFTVGGNLSMNYSVTATPANENSGTQQYCTDSDTTLYFSTSSTGCQIGTNPM